MEFFQNEWHLDETVIKALKRYGYHEPMEIQKHVIPAVLEGRDLIVRSETGSGKTAAFAIPMVQRIDIEQERVQGLVLTPTRELAVQVSEEVNKIGLYKEISCVPFYGKQAMHIQLRHLKKGVHIAVGTPGRVADLIERGALHLNSIRFMVIDEADELLRRGFLVETEKILQMLPKDRITLLFSATMSEQVDEICKHHLQHPLRIEQKIEKNVSSIRQSWMEVSEDWKYLTLTKVLEQKEPERCMIFCNTRAKADRLLEKMKQAGYPCQILHGGMEQKDRLHAMEAFKHNRVPILITTDLAARGIHVKEMDLVINYSIPQEVDSYIHRIGRTGRAGRSGEAISFVSEYEKAKWAEILAESGMKVHKKDKDEFIKHEPVVSNGPTLNKKKISERGKQIDYKKNTNSEKIRLNLGIEMKVKVKDILYLLQGVSGISKEDIGNVEIRETDSIVEIRHGKADFLCQELKKARFKGKSIITNKIK